ncbi:hypothetical protein COCMIDRAFT_85925, partial [Bipolaris oryzae ATCC 44560]
PLNISYFSLVKRKYSDAISGLVRNYIYYISKKTLLLCQCTGLRAALVPMVRADLIIDIRKSSIEVV